MLCHALSVLERSNATRSTTKLGVHLTGWQQAKAEPISPRMRCSPSPRPAGRPSTHLAPPSEAASGRARPCAPVHQRGVLTCRVSTPTAMEALTKHFESRVGASLERTGVKPSTFGLRAVGYLNPVRQLRPGPTPETGDGLPGPRVHRSLPPGPCGPCSLHWPGPYSEARPGRR